MVPSWAALERDQARVRYRRRRLSARRNAGAFRYLQSLDVGVRKPTPSAFTISPSASAA